MRLAVTQMARLILLAAIVVLLLPFIAAAIVFSGAGAIAVEIRRG
jgi:hypothetical protein